MAIYVNGNSNPNTVKYGVGNFDSVEVKKLYHDGDKIWPSPYHEDPAVVTYHLSLSPTSLSFDYDEYSSSNRKAVTVTCDDTAWGISNISNSDFSATVESDVIYVYPLAANSSTADTKTATISVTGTHVSTKTIAITQATNPCTISLSSESKSITNSSGSFTITAYTGGEQSWSLSSNTASSWLTVSPTTGTNGTVITFTYTSNTSSSRSGIVTFVGSEAGSVSFSVTQAGTSYSVSIPSNWNFSVGNGAGSVTTTVQSVNQGWTISSYPSWLTISPTAGTAGNTTITITYGANTGTSSRSTTVYANGNVSGKDYFKIAQAGSVSVTGITFTAGGIDDISAAGGSVDEDDMTGGTITINYSDGTTSSVAASEAELSSDGTITASNLGTTVKSRTKIGTMTITATYLGYSDSDTVDVYQEANTKSQSSTGSIPTSATSIAYSAGSPTQKSVTFTVSPSSTNVSATAGEVEISFTATTTRETSHYSYTQYTGYTTPWTSYTYTSNGSEVVCGSTSTVGTGRTSLTYVSASTSVGDAQIFLSEDGDWANSDSSSYYNGDSIYISYSANDLLYARTDTVTFYHGDDSDVERTITITQAANSVTITMDVTPSSASFAYNETGSTNATDFTVTYAPTTASVSVSLSNTTNFAYTQSISDGTGTVSVYPTSQNTSNAIRRCTLTVSNLYGTGASDTASLSQAYYTYCNLSSTGTGVSYTATTASVTVSSNLTWTMSATTGTFTMSTTNDSSTGASSISGSGSATVYFFFTQNDNAWSRSFVATISSTKGSNTFTITQNYNRSLDT